MNLTPEIKAQLEQQKKQCVYCKIIKGEIPGKLLFQDNVVQAILDIYPAKKGHVVYLLKEHYPIMPYIPAEEFRHYFGLIPQMAKAIQSAMVATSFNLFIANGGPAGQQFPHFLAHFFPRDQDDGFFNFFWKRNSTLPDEQKNMLVHNFPLMMANHFKRSPAAWHQGAGTMPDFLAEIAQQNTVLYEDEKVLCVLPGKGATPGHIEVYSKQEEKDITKLSIEDSSHLFFTASFAATALFEGLKAHGTNIILKSGLTDDNPTGRLCVHVLPRMQGDSLQSMLWQPKQPGYDLDAVAGKIKDKTWKIKYEEKMDGTRTSETQHQPKPTAPSGTPPLPSHSRKDLSPAEEIKQAMERISR